MRRSFVVAVAVLAATVALAAQRGGPAPDPLVPQGAVRQVGPHSYVIPDGNVPLVPNVGIVVGDRATLVIDPGLGRRNGETVLGEALRLSNNTEFVVASTHFHPEHTTGYIAFPPAMSRYVNSTVQEAEFAENGQRMVDLFAGRSALTADLLRDADRRVADITFEREYTLDLGGVTVQMLVVGPTHTRGDTALFVEGDRVLFAGDVVMNQSFVAATGDSSITAWLAAFDAFEAMGPTTIVPAHGEVGDATLIPTLRTIITEIRQRARTLKAEGRSADETASVILAEQQADHPGWPRANGVSALARVAWAEP